MNYSHDWFTPHCEVIRDHLKHLIGQTGLHALEIGSYEGRSANWFCDEILTGLGSVLQCVDTFTGSTDHENLVSFNGVFRRFMENIATNRNKVEVFRGTSQDFFHLNKRQYDFVFIDGSHLAKDVLSDLVSSWAWLKPGGIIVADDYGWDNRPEPEQNPRLAIDSFMACFKPEVLHLGYNAILRKTNPAE